MEGKAVTVRETEASSSLAPSSTSFKKVTDLSFLQIHQPSPSPSLAMLSNLLLPAVLALSLPALAYPSSTRDNGVRLVARQDVNPIDSPACNATTAIYDTCYNVLTPDEQAAIANADVPPASQSREATNPERANGKLTSLLPDAF